MPTLSERPPFASRVVLPLAALTLALHVVTNLVTPFGIHRDEFLYFAMGRHLRLWHMDFPPVIAILSEVQRFVFGDSLLAVRLVPAVASTVIVALAALLARELGGGAVAQGFAALAVLGSLFFQRAGNLFQPVILDALWWTLGFYVLARLCGDEKVDGRRWLQLGIVGGIGLLTKFSILFFSFGVLLALLATPHRRALLGRWPYVALAVALAIGSPTLAGQLALGWPLVGQMQDLRANQLGHVTVAGFLLVQLLFGPAMLVGAWGAVRLFAAPALKPFRLIGWAVLVPWLTLIVLHGKPYYVGATYPMLFAAGGVALESAAARWGRVLTSAAVWATAAYGLLVLPLGVPILAPGPLQRYMRAVGAAEATRDNRGRLQPLPQDYADMLGWEERAQAVAQAFRSLSPLERARAVVIGNNYGEAGALDFYGPRYGLPPAISAAGSYYFFGPGKLPGRVAVTLGENGERLRQLFDSVEAGPHLTDSLTVVEERDLTVYICRKPRSTLQEIWPQAAGRH
jgi:hypothetical protein